MRTTGYYWVRFEGCEIWEIGYCDATTLEWTLMNTTTKWKDQEFVEINEQQIKYGS